MGFYTRNINNNSMLNKRLPMVWKCVLVDTFGSNLVDSGPVIASYRCLNDNNSHHKFTVGRRLMLLWLMKLRQGVLRIIVSPNHLVICLEQQTAVLLMKLWQWILGITWSLVPNHLTIHLEQQAANIPDLAHLRLTQGRAQFGSRLLSENLGLSPANQQTLEKLLTLHPFTHTFDHLRSALEVLRSCQRETGAGPFMAALTLLTTKIATGSMKGSRIIPL